VSDLQRSIDFFEALGFTFNAQFTDATATAMLVGEDAYFMLLTKEKFESFSKRPLGDPAQRRPRSTRSVSRAEPQWTRWCTRPWRTRLARAGPAGHGFMYGWSFYDPDGHHWEVFWMDPSVPGDPGRSGGRSPVVRLSETASRRISFPRPLPSLPTPHP
jgi:predicted lactoylglutathione lyase